MKKTIKKMSQSKRESIIFLSLLVLSALLIGGVLVQLDYSSDTETDVSVSNDEENNYERRARELGQVLRNQEEINLEDIESQRDFIETTSFDEDTFSRLGCPTGTLGLNNACRIYDFDRNDSISLNDGGRAYPVSVDTNSNGDVFGAYLLDNKVIIAKLEGGNFRQIREYESDLAIYEVRYSNNNYYVLSGFYPPEDNGNRNQSRREIVRYNTNNNSNFQRIWSNNDNSGFFDLAVDSNNNIYTYNSSRDILIKMNSQGNIAYSREISTNDNVRGIHVNDNRVYLRLAGKDYVKILNSSNGNFIQDLNPSRVGNIESIDAFDDKVNFSDSRDTVTYDNNNMINYLPGLIAVKTHTDGNKAYTYFLERNRAAIYSIDYGTKKYSVIDLLPEIKTEGLTVANNTIYYTNTFEYDRALDFFVLGDRTIAQIKLSDQQVRQTSYFTFNDSASRTRTVWNLIGNPGNNPIDARVQLGTSINFSSSQDRLRALVNIPPKSNVTPSINGTKNGPVTISGTGDFYSTQRVLFDGSFNEFEGIKSDELTSEYYFTWYDNRPSRGNSAWIMIGNPNIEEVVDVDIEIAGNIVDSVRIAPGRNSSYQFDIGPTGPVIVKEKNGKNIYTTQRTLTRGSFNEYAGIPSNSLTNEYYFTWYDNRQSRRNNTWILVGNPNNSAKEIEIYLGNELLETVNIQANSNIARSYPELLGGPIKVASKDGSNIYASQRALLNGSFNEYAGIPSSDLRNEYYFTWYDTRRSRGNRTWVLVGNPNNTSITVDAYLENMDNIKETKEIAANSYELFIYEETLGGPFRVKARNNASIYASQRSIIGDSFNEYPGIDL